MPNRIAAKGYTRVVLVLNMKRFIRDKTGRDRFETLRGTEEFAQALQNEWPLALSADSPFHLLRPSQMASKEVQMTGEKMQMTSEEVGFATGVFRSLMLKRQVAPTYELDKEKVHFPADLENNFQFKTLFKRAWNRWSIRIRPTMTGFFVICLTYRYQESPRTLIDLAKDAIKLQEPLDVPSAVEWMRKNKVRYREDPGKLARKERSVQELLKWLGADPDNPEASQMRYYPVQWKLAVEAINRFVQAGDFRIPYLDGAVRLEPAPPTLSLPLHDSYIIYHFDELLVEPKVLKRGAQARPGVKIPAALHDIRRSKILRNTLVNLLEGTVLRDPDKPDDAFDGNGYFPSPRWSRADALIQENLASWSDELCLFTPRSALIMPSQKWRKHEMAVSTVPSATLKVTYERYWEAVERMIEFVLEVYVLAKLIESNSYRLLTQIAETVEQIRSDMFQGDIRITDPLQAQMTRAAHLGRIAALGQSLSHAPFWSRAEYAVQKAEYLFQVLDVPRIFAHIERNIDSINSVADHVDELYLADLSEKSNDKATLLSIGLAAISFTMVFLALPSFWADLAQSYHQIWPSETVYRLIFVIGNLLALALMGAAIWFLRIFWKRRRDMKIMLNQLVDRAF